MAGEKCFCHFNGYQVKDATARAAVAERITKSPFQFLNEYNDCLKNEIAECALSYYRNAQKLYYGNESIATSTDEDRQNPVGYYYKDSSGAKRFRWTALERVEEGESVKYYYIFTSTEYNNGKDGKETALGKMFTCSDAEVRTYMDQARAMVDRVVCQIDCSSFVNLVMSGVPFERSRYAKWMNTDGDTDNSPFYEWGYIWSAADVAEYYKNRGRLGAADLAKYCHDKGYSVDVTDWKKLQTGDLLFVTTPDSETTAFEKITHVMMYLYPNTVGSSDEVDHWVIDVGSQDESANEKAPVSIKRVGPTTSLVETYENTILAGRLPITLNRTAHPENIVERITKNLPYTIEETTTKNLLSIQLQEAIDKESFYTVVVDVDVDADFTTENPDAAIGISYNGSFLAARKTVKNNRSGSHYIFTIMQGLVGYGDEVKNFAIFSCRNGNISEACYHKKTTVRGVSVYKGIYPKTGNAPKKEVLFTIGESVAATADANSLILPGKYLISSGCANMPASAPQATADMLVVPQAGSWIKQIAIYTSKDLTNSVFVRMGNGGTTTADFGKWFKIVTESE